MNAEELPITRLEKFLKKYQEMNGGDFPSPEIVYAQIEMMREEHDQQSKGMYAEEEVKNLVIHASGHGFIEAHPEEGTGVDLAFKAHKYAHSYWESIKPKK